MKKLLLILYVSVLLCACKTGYLTHPLYLNDVQYTWKPRADDSVRHGTYVSGSFLAFTNDINGSAEGTAGLLNVYQSHTFKNANLNLSYGIIGFLGNYQRQSTTTNSAGVTVDQGLNFNKSFQGIGGNLSLSFFTLSDNSIEWRPFGIDVVYTKEFGDYARFRQQGINNDDVQFFPKTELLTLGIFTEMNVKASNDVKVALKFGLNNSPAYPSLDSSPIPFLQTISFNGGVMVKQLMLGLALKTTPTQYFLAPVGVQFNAGYRF